MNHRRYWSAEEVDLVINAHHQIMASGTLSSRTQDNWRRAQEMALSPDRWRTFATAASVSDLNKEYRRRAAEGLLKAPGPVIETPPPEVVFVEGWGEVPKEAYHAVVSHHKQANPPAPVTLDAIFRQIVVQEVERAIPAAVENTLAGKIENHFSILEGMLFEQFGRMMMAIDPNWRPPVQEVIPEIEGPPKVHKPLVILINANAAQFHSFQKEFPQFEVRVTKERLPAEETPLLVVGFTRFMSEGLDKQLHKKYHESYLRVTGAVSDAKTRVKARLHNLLFEVKL